MFGGVADTGLPMPYGWISALPGLDFLRTPARFMQVALSVSPRPPRWDAAIARPGRSAAIAAAIVAAALLVEVWPVAWPTQTLPRVPAFYAALAHDGEHYGVLDLPIRPLPDLSPVTTRRATRRCK